VKSFLNKLESEMPGTKHSIVSQGRKLSELVDENVEFDKKENRLRECEKCGEPCSSDVCRKCQLLEDIKKSADESEDHEFEMVEETE